MRRNPHQHIHMIPVDRSRVDHHLMTPRCLPQPLPAPLPHIPPTPDTDTSSSTPGDPYSPKPCGGHACSLPSFQAWPHPSPEGEGFTDLLSGAPNRGTPTFEVGERSWRRRRTPAWYGRPETMLRNIQPSPETGAVFRHLLIKATNSSLTGTTSPDASLFTSATIPPSADRRTERALASGSKSLHIGSSTSQVWSPR
jgi:hypothetical protein